MLKLWFKKLKVPSWMRKLSDIMMLEIVSSGKSLLLSVNVLNTVTISVSFASLFLSRENKKKKKRTQVSEI